MIIVTLSAQAFQVPSIIQFEFAEETSAGSGIPGVFSGVGAVQGVLDQFVELTFSWPNTNKTLYYRCYLQIEGMPDSDYSETVQYTPPLGTPASSTLFDPIDAAGAVSQLIFSGTGLSYLFTDPGTGADSPAGAPPVPAIPTIHSGNLTHVLEIRDYVKPADFRWFDWQYDHTTGGWASLAKTTSTNLVHTRLDPALTYRYRVKAVDRAGNESAFATTGNATAVASSVRPDQIIAEQITVGSITAGKISVVDLSAISANLGTITAGVARDTNSKFVVDFNNVNLVVTDNQGSPVVRSRYGKVGSGTTDYGIQVFDQNAATVIDFTGAKRILAVPLQNTGVKSGTFTVDLSSGLTTQITLGSGNSTPAGTLRMVFSGQVDGGRYRVWLQQNTSGNSIMPQVDNIVMWPNDTPPVLSTTPGAFDVLEFEYRASPTPRFAGWLVSSGIFLPSPRVQSITTTQFNSDATSHNASLPSTVVSGELLLMFTCFDGDTAVTTPGGWTMIMSGGVGALGTLAEFTAHAIISSGIISPTVNVVTDSAQQGAAQVYRIDHWYGSLLGVSGTAGVTGNSVSPNPDAITVSWDVDRNLYIAAFGEDSIDTVNAYPTNYTNGTYTAGGSQADGASVGSARRSLYSTTEDPGTFTFQNTQQWRAMTFAVRPPA